MRFFVPLPEFHRVANVDDCEATRRLDTQKYLPAAISFSPGNKKFVTWGTKTTFSRIFVIEIRIPMPISSSSATKSTSYEVHKLDIMGTRVQYGATVSLRLNRNFPNEITVLCSLVADLANPPTKGQSPTVAMGFIGRRRGRGRPPWEPSWRPAWRSPLRARTPCTARP